MIAQSKRFAVARIEDELNIQLDERLRPVKSKLVCWTFAVGFFLLFLLATISHYVAD